MTLKDAQKKIDRVISGMKIEKINSRFYASVGGLTITHSLEEINTVLNPKYKELLAQGVPELQVFKTIIKDSVLHRVAVNLNINE